MKIVLVLTALVKYPSSESFYLSSNSYAVEKNTTEVDRAVQDFREHIEVDGFTIKNLIAYVVPAEQSRACIDAA